jgi:hypothetical protein
MAAMGVYDQIKAAFQDMIAPELHALRGDLQRLEQKVDGVDQRLTQKIDGLDQRLLQRIDGLDQRHGQKIDGLDQKMDGVDARLTVRIDSLRTETLSMKAELLAEIRRLDTRIEGIDRELRTVIDIRERLAALEARRPA